MPWPSIESPVLRWIPWGSLRLRLTLLNSAAVILTMLALLLSIRLAFRQAILRDNDETLRAEVRETVLALRELDDAAVVAELRRKAESHRERGWFVQLLDGPESTVWASDNCPEAIRRFPVDVTVLEKVSENGELRWARRSTTLPDGRTMHVRIGMAKSLINREVDTLTWFMIPLGLGFTLLTPLAGYWLALRATRPIAGILRSAERLKPTKLGDRLETRGTRDELDQLSSTINRLLDQVARYVERQQQFVADAAHELRGPLAAMQNSLEVATAKHRSTEDYRSALEDVLGETRHLSRLANDLLLLAEVGNSLGSMFNEVVDVAGVVRETVAMFAGVAEDRGIRLEVHSSGSAVVRGDQRQLRQLLGNLVDNALRFTPAGGLVAISVSADTSRREATVAVADNGRGVPKEFLDRVFDRFFQADTARDRGDIQRGGGLGLSICRSIVERHGGRITLTSPGTDQGTTVTVVIPLHRAPG